MVPSSPLQCMNELWFWVDHVGDMWQGITSINQAKMTTCCHVALAGTVSRHSQPSQFWWCSSNLSGDYLVASSKKTRKVIVRQFTCLDWAGQSQAGFSGLFTAQIFSASLSQSSRGILEITSNLERVSLWSSAGEEMISPQRSTEASS